MIGKTTPQEALGSQPIDSIYWTSMDTWVRVTEE